RYPLPSWAPPDLPEHQLYILRALNVVLEQEPEFILELIPIFRRYCSDRVEFMRRLDRLAARWEKPQAAGGESLTNDEAEHPIQTSERSDPC
ncbi:MAG: hypothetical protein ACREEM_07805, partial [Blastocatellia bacterium]